MKASKTIIESKKRLSLTQENLFHKYDSYCCTSCSAVPEILDYNEANHFIKFKCKKHGENTLDLKEYLEKMASWEKTSDLKSKNRCSTHNEKYEYYCKECKENICIKCLELPNHKEHIKYELNSLRLNNTEILLIKEKINIFLQKKDELIRNIRDLEDRITFYDTLITSYERQNPNYLLNMNLKHILYGDKLNYDELKKAEFVYKESKKEAFDIFIKDNFLQATKGLKQLNLSNKKIENDLLEEFIKGIEDNTIFKILKFRKMIQSPKEVIMLKDIKYMNLRGNKISSLNFISGKDLRFLEFLCLNDNELNSIDNLKTISFPILKELYLAKNKINNIDILSQLNIPKLRILWLSNNNITSIEVLKNVKFQQLGKLALNKNKIKDISVFEKGKAKFPQLFELYLNDNDINKKVFYKIIKELYNKIQEFYC